MNSINKNAGLQGTCTVRNHPSATDVLFIRNIHPMLIDVCSAKNVALGGGVPEDKTVFSRMEVSILSAIIRSGF